jgi:hypothetical protein
MSSLESAIKPLCLNVERIGRVTGESGSLAGRRAVCIHLVQDPTATSQRLTFSELCDLVVSVAWRPSISCCLVCHDSAALQTACLLTAGLLYHSNVITAVQLRNM